MGTVSYNGNTFSNITTLDINLGSGEIKLGLNRSNSKRSFSIKRGSKIKLDGTVSIGNMKLECSRPIVYVVGEVRNVKGKHCHLYIAGDAMKVESGKVYARDKDTCDKEISKSLSQISSNKGKEEHFRLKGSFESISVFAGQCNCDLSGNILDLETGGTLCVEGNVGVVNCREIYCNRVSGFGLMQGII